MAKEYGIEDPPNAGGGCLLTDPKFGVKTKDLFDHTETPTINDIDLLKVGRHFRFDEVTKIVVGRNKNENDIIESIALPGDTIPQARDHMGPVCMLRTDNGGGAPSAQNDHHNTRLAAAITLRYSDAPKDGGEHVVLAKRVRTEAGGGATAAEEKEEEIRTTAASDASYARFRIG